MSEYEQTRDVIEKEINAVRKNLDEHPEWFSTYGKGYWAGNVDALNWVLTKLAEIHLSRGTER